MNWKPSEWLERFRTEIVLALVGLTFIGFGVFLWRTDGNNETKLEIISSNDVASPESKAKIMVDMAGAVKNSGVVEMNFGDRVDQAIAAAGGLADEADLEWLDKNLNRSEKLKDGMKIYVPRVGEGRVMLV